MSNNRTYYQVLHVDPEADPDVIDVAYKRLARKYHPDSGGAEASNHKMRLLNEAYETLRDPQARRQYDAKLEAAQAASNRVSVTDMEAEARAAMMEFLRSMQTQTATAPRPAGTWSGRLAALDGTAIIKAQDGTYLGVISSNSYEADSLSNTYRNHGSSYSQTSIRNSYSQYGSQYGSYSAFNPHASAPPVVVQNGRAIAYLTVNPRLKPAISPHELLATFG